MLLLRRQWKACMRAAGTDLTSLRRWAAGAACGGSIARDRFRKSGIARVRAAIAQSSVPLAGPAAAAAPMAVPCPTYAHPASLHTVYPDDTEAAIARFAALSAAFTATYGAPPDFFVRSPGACVAARRPPFPLLRLTPCGAGRPCEPDWRAHRL
jgi:hypothetical protein